MRVNIEISDEMDKKLLACAQKDGHKSRGAVIRKILQLFFAQKLAFSCFCKEEK